VASVKYSGRTGGLLTQGSECAYAVRNCLGQAPVSYSSESALAPAASDIAPANTLDSSTPRSVDASAQARQASWVMSTPIGIPAIIPAGASEPQIVRETLYQRCVSHGRFGINAGDMFGISKRGDRYLRTLLIHGARAALGRAGGKQDPRSRWLGKLRERRHPNIVAVALANKNARIAWALLSNGQTYDPRLAVGSA